jgi:two-component system response regulator AtoC
MTDLHALMRRIEARSPHDPELSVQLSTLADGIRDLEVRARAWERCRSLLARTAGLAHNPSVQGDLEPIALDLLQALALAVGARGGAVARLAEDGALVTLASHRLSGEGGAQAPLSRSIAGEALASGRPVLLDDAQQGPFAEIGSVLELGLRSVLCVPLGRDTFVQLESPETGEFDDSALEIVSAWLPILDRVLRPSPVAQPQARPPLPGVPTRSPLLHDRLVELGRVAPFDVNVMLWGETGTGKSFLARRVHEASPRARGPFVHVNCAALPADLVESELFGAEAGAYTGARARRPGRFETAHRGTLFLDELNHLPVELQGKLLVAVQERAVTRLGGTSPVPVDVRLLSATSTPPQEAMARGQLREELYYRLAVIEVRVPPLRERMEDIELLARDVLGRAAARFGLPLPRMTASALAELRAYSWPGNVRELENLLDRAALLAGDEPIRTLSLPARAPSAATPPATPLAKSAPIEPRPLRRYGVEREEFLAAWQAEEGSVDAVASALGVSRRTVYRLVKRYLEGGSP